MKLAFLVEVEIDDAQFAKVNAERKQQGQQLHTEQDFGENLIVDALKSAIIPDVRAAVATKVPRRAAWKPLR